jgi:hypothetical protein
MRTSNLFVRLLYNTKEAAVERESGAAKRDVLLQKWMLA